MSIKYYSYGELYDYLIAIIYNGIEDNARNNKDCYAVVYVKSQYYNSP